MAFSTPPVMETSNESINESIDDTDSEASTKTPKVSAGSTYSSATTLAQCGTPPRALEDEEGLVRAPAAQEASYSIYSRRQKNFIVFMSSLGGFSSPLSANTYLPALPVLAAELRASTKLINLTITSFMVFQAVSPSFYGDLADMAGRRPAYLVSFVIYVGANVGLSLQNSYPALFVLRALQSAGCSATYSLNSGVVADISTTAERGKYLGAAQSGIMLGPAVGPILGGILTEYLGWRAVFWFLTIFGAVYLIVFAVAVPETARKVVGNGSIPPGAWWSRSVLNELARRNAEKHGIRSGEAPRKPQLRFPNPLKSLRIIAEKDCAVLMFYNAFVYASYYTVTAAMSSLLTDIYGLNTLQVGLCYIPFGVGAALSIFINGRLQDWNYKRVARANNFPVDRKRGDDLTHFPIEQARLEIVRPFLYVGLSSIIGFGWSLYVETHLAVPLVLTFTMSLTLTACYNSMNLLLVDLYPDSPSTASAANNLTRCLVGAAGTAMIEPLIGAVGRGLAFTIVALFVAGLSPMLWVMTSFGPRWREERRLRVQRQEERKAMAEKSTA